MVYRDIKGGRQERNWRVYPFVKDIQAIAKTFEEFECKWINRKANQATDWIAKQVRKGMYYPNWVNLPPSSLVHKLSKDGLPAPPL